MNNLNNEAIQLRASYDYIVIGSGSAGSIVASKLSANPNITVLLLEAGKSAASVADVWNPRQINCLYNDASIDWGYKTVPQVNMNNRVLDYSRAKMTGGCTSHNDMVYTRGAPADFNLWESEHGCVGWNYNNIVHNFENIEAALQPTQTIENEFAVSFIQACENMGIPYNSNYNSGENMFGVSPLQATINNKNIRETSFQTYITPNLERPNLDVLIYCNVQELIFNTYNKATGVNFVYNNTISYSVNINKEVILSAGAINTPAILMRSGIGDASKLKELGLQAIISDLPGVGQNLQDAIIFKGSWSTKQPIYNQPTNEGYVMAWSNMTQYQQPTTCIEMMRGTYVCGESEPELESHYSITGGAMRLKSIGSVILNSLSYIDAPIIDLNFYSNPNDMQQAIDAFNLMRALGNSAALAPWRNQELVPGPNVVTSEQIENWILQNSYSYSHASCTCKMGTDSDAVVDPDLRVKGVSGLRIADISIMPFITSGHTQGPAFMIGDKAAELIISNN
ncbi:GMC family oxidoreductase [Wocania ichthyoenteri]|uniref:GMC family oxidoreductase n=1 Tax=Wocania ichthyoenteri TaxID=1230531 RepID=UPI00053E7CA1|nr:GMC family oxidoreductase N-terminal domain-containing protein [Wocania ichthyoenteri]